MKWFVLSIVALLCWSFSDLFSKIGCADSRDKHSALKMVTAVGVVMGIHAMWSSLSPRCSPTCPYRFFTYLR